MKANTPSRTAQYMALFRAIETTKQEGKRLFDDPYVIHFLDKSLQQLVRIASWPIIGRLIPALIHQRAPGALSSGIARTKYIDDLFQMSINEGARQAIILGAGFDTRSMRLYAAKNISIIEIDHPDTSNFKQAILEQAIGHVPLNVRFHQADFNRSSLAEIREAAKIDFSIPTVIIWEGVSNYLTPEAVDGVFQFTQSFDPPFTIIFTYIDKDVLLRPHHFRGTKKLFQRLKNSNEEWTFGFDPEVLGHYLQTYHLTLKEDLSATDYRRHYLSGKGGINEGYEFYSVAMAQR